MTAPKSDALARAVDAALERHANAPRSDGWESSLLSLGTSEDKIASLRYSGFVNRLSDPVLEAMFMTEVFSYNGTVVYPEVAFSEGVKYQGLTDPDGAREYLDEQFRLPEVATEGAIWGRLYGGCATWIVTDRDLAELEEELDPGEEILGLRNVERPFVVPIMDPDTFDVVGNPQWFMVNPPQGHIHATIHISRLVLWPGDLTPQRRRIQIGYWDFSALQRPFDVLKRNGYVSQAAQQLLSEASIGVLGVQGIWSAASSGNLSKLATRMRTFNMAKNNARAILIDKDKEQFQRVNTTFAGVADLTNNARQEVAAAFAIPMTRLMGTTATGISGDAAGDSSERVFQKNVKTKQKFVYEPRVAKLAKALLGASQAPVSADGLALLWPDLWAPTAAENATIYSTTAAADVALINAEVITPQEAKTRFKPEGYSQELDMPGEGAEADDELDPADLLGVSEGGNTPDGAGAEPDQKLEPQSITALTDIIGQVASKKLPRDSAQELITLSFGVTPEQADKLLGSAGKDFVTGGEAAQGNAPKRYASSIAQVLEKVSEGKTDPASAARILVSTYGLSEEEAQSALGTAPDGARGDGFDPNQERDEDGRGTGAGAGVSDGRLKKSVASVSELGIGEHHFDHSGGYGSGGTTSHRYEDEHVSLHHTIVRAPDGKNATAHIDLAHVEKNDAGQGRGTALLAGLARGYKSAGVNRVTLDATYQGAHVWPRLGFTPDPQHAERAVSAARAGGIKADSYSDLVGSREGRAFLEQHTSDPANYIRMSSTPGGILAAIKSKAK